MLGAVSQILPATPQTGPERRDGQFGLEIHSELDWLISQSSAHQEPVNKLQKLLAQLHKIMQQNGTCQ